MTRKQRPNAADQPTSGRTDDAPTSARNASGAGATREESSQIGLWLGVRGLLLAALVIAAYLSWHALVGTRPVGCGPTSGCDRVLQSRWAGWFGVPVSLLALGAYGAMLWASFAVQRPPNAVPAWRRGSELMLIGGAVAVLLMAAWFVGLQALLLRAFCRYCLVAHGCGGLASALVLWKAARASPTAALWARAARPATTPLVQAKTLGFGLWAGLAAAGVVVLGQLVHQPKTFRVTTLPVPANAGTSGPSPTAAGSDRALAARGAAQTPEPVQAVRLFSFYDGRFTVNLHDVPVIGSPTNRQVVVSLFDYTCHHCQVMHHVLLEAQRRYGDQLVIVSLPVPLDPQCNPWVIRAPPEHTNACAYARLGLAVWRADRTKHREFDDWMFAEASPPPLAQAVSKAQALVGPAALAQAQQDPWIEQQLKLALAVYGVAYQANRGEMPQMIVGTNVALGSFPRDEFFALLERNLGLKPQP